MSRTRPEMEIRNGYLRSYLESPPSVTSNGACNGGGLSLDQFVDAADPSFVRRAVLPLALGNAADAVEILSAGYIISVFRDEDGNPLTSTEKELLTAAVFMGMLIGGVVAGNAGDILGRRYCLLISLSVTVTFGTLSALAPSIAWLIAARVIAGIGVGGSIPVVFTLGAELFPTHIRGAMVSLIASFWMIGSIFAATAAWILLGDGFGGDRIVPGATWRHYTLVAALPAGMALLFTVLFVPESPRFLAKAGRFDDMLIVLDRIANRHVHLPPEALIQSQNARRSPLGADIPRWLHSRSGGLSYSHIRRDSSSDEIVDELGGASSESKAISFVPKRGLLRLVWTEGNKKLQQTTLTLVVVWFTLSFGSYGVSTWNNVLFADVGLSNPYLCSFIYCVASLPGNAASILLVERVGRRRLLSLSMTLAAASASLFAFGTRLGAPIVVLGGCLFNAFSTCGWNALDVVSTESFPTSSRTSGMGLVSAAGRLGSVAAQFVNGSLEDTVLLLLMVTSGLTLVGGMASLCLARDTRGVSLEDPASSSGEK